ncbi:MAG: thioredoxin [Endomicrobiia bacterium]
MTKEINDVNFDQEVLKSTTPVLVDFWAEWCGPCRMLGPIIDELSKEFPEEKIKIRKLNVDNNQNTASKYGIMAIPTVILFHNGQPVEQIVGVRSKKDYAEIINKYITK